jgi:hypothetical protein
VPGAYKLGKHPPIHDDRTFAFSSYVTAALPPPPASVTYYQKVPTWPMYYNDQYGDCTCAAAGHMIQNWTANAATEVTPPDQTILSFYEHFVGTPPPPDQGCNMLSVLRYWRKTGLDQHKVYAFASLELQNQLQAQNAISLLGGIYLGVQLPDFTVPQGGDWMTIPWAVPANGPTGTAAPNPQNGHCIPAVGYDADQLWIVTWGGLKSMTWGFYNTYADESYAIVSTDFIGPEGKSPEGFDLAALSTDLTHLGG